MEEQVKVHIRVRPASQEETKSKDFRKCVEISDPQTLKLYFPRDTIRPFHFDSVLEENSTEEEVYDSTARDLVDSVLEGYHGTLFVYGQTGTGKTHTMGLLKKVTTKSEGIVPAAIKHIFERVKEGTVTLSFLQIYMENIYDLLNPTKKTLLLREDANSGIFVKDLTQVPVDDFSQAANLINAGLCNRIMGSTNANQTSSRSHIVLTLDIESTINEKTIYSKLTLIDLAGSERVRGTSSSGQRLDEAKFINGSLSALGKVICALASETSGHIPFRDSKLTRLLQPSLRGKVVMIATVGPSYASGSETISTLQFASRCKEVVSFPVLYDEESENPEPQLKIPSGLLEELEELRKKEEVLIYRIKELEQQNMPIFSHSNSEVIYYLLRLLSKLTQTSIKLTQEMHKTRNSIPKSDREIAEEQFPYPISNYDFSSDESYMGDIFVKLDQFSSTQIVNKVQFFAKKLVENLNVLGRVAIDAQFMKSAIRGIPYKHNKEIVESFNKEANEALKPMMETQEPVISYEEPPAVIKFPEIVSQEPPQRPQIKLSVKELMKAKKENRNEPARTESMAAQFTTQQSTIQEEIPVKPISPKLESDFKFLKGFEHPPIEFSPKAEIQIENPINFEVPIKASSPKTEKTKPELTIKQQEQETPIRSQSVSISRIKNHQKQITKEESLKTVSPSPSSNRITQKKRAVNPKIEPRSKSPILKLNDDDLPRNSIKKSNQKENEISIKIDSRSKSPILKASEEGVRNSISKQQEHENYSKSDIRSKSPNFKVYEDDLGKSPVPKGISQKENEPVKGMSKTPERTRSITQQKQTRPIQSKSPKVIKKEEKKLPSVIPNDDFLSQLEKELAIVNGDEDELDAWLKNCDVPLP
ncbi:unnamed protein product [Blepharisma stoltei]|uniref:Kinesin-like protein n=1 Tax=Blepharisma stoltei TaxID=1481888 RepID=A0AAU9K7R8_9CILI|nr:unnamed protein product [Blepharisma stoltei]